MVFHHKMSAKDHHTGNHEPQTIPNPIHNILSGRKGEVSKNAYLDTIDPTEKKFK
jgi:hypothetical protein